ncbi:DUF2789 domain-containing protein [Pseudomonas sp. WS 5071]|uniref:DUF2789 domain-containing protein n=1 Tax=Pseudomonas sp. WS 5071 TaxID=2717479 RepID=UPI001474B156|nr:DUF2789 domain-containing protein [Pseudomonas sp. WS 5071]NMY74832.1 DUF2789 domain-containing protein [Pseudomonas sp. WS 5071]
MDETPITLENLFNQLGLDADRASIEQFVADHFLAEDVKLGEAPFWSTAQASFLKEKLAEDGPWALAVDELNVRLHESVHA